MCQRVTCSTCQRPTYAGCGNHIEQVLGDVPTADRCQGHTANAADPSAKRSWFGRLRAKAKV